MANPIARSQHAWIRVKRDQAWTWVDRYVRAGRIHELNRDRQTTMKTRYERNNPAMDTLEDMQSGYKAALQQLIGDKHWTLIELLAATEERIWDACGMSILDPDIQSHVDMRPQPPGKTYFIGSWMSHQHDRSVSMMNFSSLMHTDMPTARAFLRELSPKWLDMIERILIDAYFYEPPELIQEERQRRIDSLERRHYAQSNMSGMIESRRVPSVGYPVGAAIQDLIGSFLSRDIGTAPAGHLSRIPRVPPHFGPAWPYEPQPPAAAPAVVGQTRKAADSDAARSSKRSKHDA